MTIKKDWKMTFALILLIVLLGGYYEKLGVEGRTMVLPLAIFIAAGIIIARLKNLEYETRSAKVNAKDVIVQNFSVIDRHGKQRVAISTTADTALMSFFDEQDIPCATFDILNTGPILKLVGNNGSVSITFDEEGRPKLTLKDDMDENIWSAK
ncbi:MAG: hypothetical protein JRF17_05385 [Deltaproteobacteria bacterium]|jgi:hypothetical protein|nr:hypothetical protein [Deltaproteobacteria bacterium]MBW2490439.1 hypothetical protein [Deltaproteobacteria bacterium]